MELNIQLSSAKKWISGLGGSSWAKKKDTRYSEKGKKPWTGFESSSPRKGSNKSPQSFSQSKSCYGNSCSEIDIEELNERLKVLEEETEKMKEAFFWGLEERKVIVKEIYKHFKSLNLQGFLQSSGLAIEESSEKINPIKDWRVKDSLPDIVRADKNPALITKELRVGALTLQEPVCNRGDGKYHHE